MANRPKICDGDGLSMLISMVLIFQLDSLSYLVLSQKNPRGDSRMLLNILYLKHWPLKLRTIFECPQSMSCGSSRSRVSPARAPSSIWFIQFNAIASSSSNMAPISHRDLTSKSSHGLDAFFQMSIQDHSQENLNCYMLWKYCDLKLLIFKKGPSGPGRKRRLSFCQIGTARKFPRPTS